jgi:16S rRNA processing protein RimM
MDLVAIGRISKPIGTQGEVRVLPLTDDQKRFENLKSVLIGKEETTATEHDILAVRVDAKYVVVRLKGIESVEVAKTLRDRYLFVPKENAVKLRPGSYFVDDLIGCEVVTEEQIKVGIVSDLLELPANDIMVVNSGVKEILIPAVKAIIRQVDIGKKCITIHAVEGLLE